MWMIEGATWPITGMAWGRSYLWWRTLTAKWFLWVLLEAAHITARMRSCFAGRGELLLLEWSWRLYGCLEREASLSQRLGGRRDVVLSFIINCNWCGRVNLKGQSLLAILNIYQGCIKYWRPFTACTRFTKIVNFLSRKILSVKSAKSTSKIWSCTV